MGESNQANPDLSTHSVRFEDAVDQIEQMIEKIESGQVGLEEAIVDYERATKLIGHCRSILKVAQTRIAELTSDAEGRLRMSEEPDQESVDS